MHLSAAEKDGKGNKLSLEQVRYSSSEQAVNMKVLGLRRTFRQLDRGPIIGLLATRPLDQRQANRAKNACIVPIYFFTYNNICGALNIPIIVTYK